MSSAESFLNQAEPLAQPVSTELPQGLDLSYEADFGLVRAEIDKLTTMSGELPNWRDVALQSEALLRNRSKDLRLLVWLAAAKFKTEGIRGLAFGLAATRLVVDRHWDGMFPPLKRAKARANLASWLADQITPELTAFEPAAADKDTVEAISVFYNDLDEVLSSKLGDAYTGMGSLRSIMRDKVRSVPAVAQAVAAPAASAPSPAPQSAVAAESEKPTPVLPPAVSAPLAVSVPTIKGPGDVASALRELGKGIGEAAKQVRAGEPSSAFGFRLARVAAWLAVRQAPPSESQRTKIAPPPQDEVRKLVGLHDSQQWAAVVATAESMAGRFLFWLDAHRLSAVALQQLGPPWLDAHQVVVGELLRFVELHPQTVELSFSDGTPFASSATRAWIEDEQSKVKGKGGGASASSQRVSEEDQELRARLEEAKQLVTAGKAPDGLALAMQLARRASDERARFRARFEVGLMALAAGKADVARGILEGLAQEGDRHDLEHWEPDLFAATLDALLKARRAAGGSKTDGSKAEPTDAALYLRLCALDPAAAIRNTGN
jgi:type VI secretion system protein VasJ